MDDTSVAALPAPGDTADTAGQPAHGTDMLRELAAVGYAYGDPAAVTIRRDRHLIEVLLDEVGHVHGWAAELDLGAVLVDTDPDLRQTITGAAGPVHGWAVIVRHIHTEPSGVLA